MIGYDEKRKTYFVQYQVKDPLTGKWNTRKKRGFKLKRDAAQFLRSAKYTDDEIMSQERPVWTPEQYKRFIDCVDLPIYRVFFDFLYWTGCRRGEAMAL